ncbi:pyrimidine utilization transport protein G [Enterobacter hormaechei]|jgi:putative pyrimidine permease RutG|uniref:Pyrimidine utilization transport protein G n=1 Tax=Enterobacter hormaechei subsp. steigerwaltii TaxID=299766 RepID=A0AAE4E378_9ENTR|nr:MULTISPECIES: pyrimidine utilization transport protein G [Enterobacter]CAE7308818.1 Putative pyrimidine permease RutG [Enterobacter cloacae]VAL49027.1 pyrimidine utilization transport protein G [Enterobacter kobei]AWV76715.1 pyrimidine utilization transport protein G [Enterobacter hormaechei subsp. xiangfangensis]EHF5034208.1 pyrimidine utilization transport protein G [Enterobacter hormaechei]EHF5059457.1 pyrimidine utilization transport protein G [Enterobacter hormaechei]
MFGLPHWQLKSTSTEEGVVAPDERLPLGQTMVMGVQHAVAMFGATVLMPMLMGLDPNLAILMSGMGTLLFFFVTGGRVPSYLGSSAAFVGVVIAATGFNGQGINPNLSVALGGIIACGLVYTLTGLVVMKVGTRWIERMMPPVVTGAVVMAIGLNLAPIAVKSVSGSPFESWMAVITVLCIGVVAVFTRGMIQRLLILVGLIAACLVYALLANVFGLGKPVDFTLIHQAAWFGLPQMTSPTFNAQAMMLIAPVAVILVAENLGHLKAVAGMTGRNMDPYIGRAFVGDGLATMLSGSVGGSGVTTYAENIGVMAVTKVYSTLVFVAAAVMAMLLGFSPKFGALIHTIPAPVIGGASIVVFGLIAVAGARIWVQNHVDLSQNGNLIMVAVTLVLGAGDFALTLGGFTVGGIGTATFGAILLNALLSRRMAAAPQGAVVTQDP